MTSTAKARVRRDSFGNQLVLEQEYPDGTRIFRSVMPDGTDVPASVTAHNVHGREFKKRKGKSIAAILKKAGGFYRPAGVEEYHGTYWIRLADPSGICCDKIAITREEAADLASAFPTKH